MKRLVFAVIMLALLTQGAYAEEQNPLHRQNTDTDIDFAITPTNVRNNEIFNVVVIGDSIAWGAGLKRNEKYSYLVSKWISEKTNRPVNVKVIAHTGATLFTDSSDPVCFPELISGNPTIFQQANMITNPDSVDLILISGGINDIGVDNIIKLDHLEGSIDKLKNWGVGGEGTYSIADIRYSAGLIQLPMHILINKIIGECPNARIIVTGYYPIISNESRGLTETIRALNPESQKIGDYQHLDEPDQRNQLIDKSNIFYEYSTKSLAAAVDDSNSNSGYKHAAFARIDFEPDNCYGADQSLLWKIGNFGGAIKTDDNMFDTRMSLLRARGWVCACEPCLTPPDTDIKIIDCYIYRMNKFVGVGHPNELGAEKYNESIIKTISETWPEWLHPTVLALDVSPPSLTSGESFTIGYTVSDNDGSGLVQVELWRKNETSDWQEIKRNALAGESGPLSGSFTDSPPAPGTYWYGVHVVDNAGNWNDERNSNTNYQPVSFEPVEVEIIDSSSAQGSTNCDSAEAKSWFERGVAFYDQFDYTEAIDCFDEATKICPQYEAAWGKMGDAYLIGRFGFFSDNNPNEAIRCYDEALKINPRNATVWNNKGTAYNDLGQYDEAIQCYDEALIINPEYAEAWYGKGHSQYNQGNHGDALQSIEMAITFNPEIPPFWQEKGVILEALGYEGAQAAFDKADELKKIHKPIRKTEGAVEYD